MRIITISMLAVLSLWTYSADEPVVIVNKENPVQSVSKKELSNIFKQKQRSWDSGGAIEVLNLSKGNPVIHEFTKKMLDMSVEDLEKYYLKNALSGKGQPPRTVDSPEKVKEIVGSNKDVIGYIDSKDVDHRVKVLTVESR